MTVATFQTLVTIDEESTALVTGGTSGIGRETVRCIAETGATVLVHGRDAERGGRVCDEIAAETPGEATFVRADFADFDSVRDCAAAVRDHVADRRGALDVLVNNAGTWQGERRLVEATGEVRDGDRTDGSRAGVEYTVAVNHCAHFLLTAELWPQLRRAGGIHGEGARVITVASDLHRRADFDVAALTGSDGPTGPAAYAHSKLANVLFAAELAEAAAGAGVTSISCHPGVAPGTSLARESGGLSRTLWKAFGAIGRVLPLGPVDTAREAAGTSCYLATSADTTSLTGEYVVDREPATPSEDARSMENRRRLWNWTADVVDVDPAFPRKADAGSGSPDQSPSG